MKKNIVREATAILSKLASAIVEGNRSEKERK